MSGISGAVGAIRPPISIVNKFSAGGASAGNMTGFLNEKEILSGALTAFTLKNLLSISGAGAIKILNIYTRDATARTLRLKLSIDGVVVFDATSNSIAVSYSGMAIVGNSYYGSDHLHFPELMPFYSSLAVEIASSLTETDKVAIGIIYETR